MVASEVCRKRLPHIARVTKAVKKHHRWTFAAYADMDRRTICLDVTHLERRRVWFDGR
jgi:hypothetical protein